MEVRFLVTPDYDRSAATEAETLVRRVLDHEGIFDPIRVVIVQTEEDAWRERFLGSPSIQIDRRDIEIERRADPPTLAPRLYADGVKVPPRETIRRAIARTRAPHKRVLFLCTGNSCRSQMAEGWTRHLLGDCIDAYSAGIEPRGFNPRATLVMSEAGVDLSRQRCKRIDDIGNVAFDFVITVCDNVRERCPAFPGHVPIIHKGFDDPPTLALDAKTEEEALSHFRRVRDEIRDFVKQLPEMLEKGNSTP